MTITLNGQLLLCMLAEQMMKVPGLEMIQINTDGMTYRVPDEYVDWDVDKANTSYPSDTSRWPWDEDRDVACVHLEENPISNAAGTDVGEYGATYETVTHNPLGTGRTVKRKGTVNDGALQLSLGLLWLTLYELHKFRAGRLC